MKRRTFLTIAGIGASAMIVPVWAMTSQGFVKKTVGAIIYRHLSYLKIDEGLVDEFSAGFENYIQKYSFANEQKTRINLGRAYMFSGKEKTPIVEFVLERFLLSTDFFFNKMDESKPLKFIGFYGGTGRTCANPFSNLYYPTV